jgi:hypothetical protein
MPASLQRVLLVDFVGALATVVLLIAVAGPLSSQLGISAWALRAAGVALLPFVLFVWRTARSSAVPRQRVLGIVAFNLSWLLASVALLLLGSATPLGRWIIALQALLIVPLVFVELAALRAHREH